MDSGDGLEEGPILGDISNFVKFRETKWDSDSHTTDNIARQYNCKQNSVDRRCPLSRVTRPTITVQNN